MRHTLEPAFHERTLTLYDRLALVHKGVQPRNRDRLVLSYARRDGQKWKRGRSPHDRMSAPQKTRPYVPDGYNTQAEPRCLPIRKRGILPIRVHIEGRHGLFERVTIGLQEGESFKQEGNPIKRLIERLPWPRHKQGLVHDR